MTDITQSTDEQLLKSFGVTYPFSRKMKSCDDVLREILRRMKLGRQYSDVATHPMALEPERTGDNVK